MANTGYKLCTTLEEVDVNNGDAPTGNTKPNIPSDPDYVSPVLDTLLCSVSVNLNCPVYVILSQGDDGKVYFEFSAPAGAVANTAIDHIVVKLMLGIVLESSHSYPDLLTYHSGSFTPLEEDTYTIVLEYQDSGDVALASCTLGTVDTVLI